ncbi:MAG: hypothetical protein MJE77_05470 [Proteobacteria bacterium]|nr:hypothetical protein [Pseudomonadota bacterium]
MRHSDTDLLPQAITSFGAAEHGGWLYILGGYFGEPHAYSKEGQSGALYRLNLARASGWEQLPGIEPLQSVALTAHGDALIRVGGMRAQNRSDQPENLQSVTEVARFRPSIGRWAAMPSLPEGRSSHDAVALGNTLYVLGGWQLVDGDEKKWHSTGLALNLDDPSSQWEAFDVPFERRALAVAAVGDHLVAIGGMSSDGEPSRRVDIYDVKAKSWSRGPDYPASPFGIGAVGTDEYAYASGGDGTVYRLSVGNGRWEMVKKLRFPRFFHRLVRTSQNEIVVVGGILGMSSKSRVRHVERVSVGPGSTTPRITRWTLTAPGPAKNRQGIFLRGNTLYVFGGNNSLEQHDFESDNFLTHAHKLHLGMLKWEPMKPYPVPRQTMQTVVSQRSDVGISVGGFGHDGKAARTHAESYLYDFDGDIWTPRSGALPVPRSQFGLTRHGGELWVFGGLDYDPSRADSDHFRHLKPVLVAKAGDASAPFIDSGVELPQPRRAFGGALLDGRYYLIGGMRDGFQLVDACDVFEFATKTWHTIPAPRRTRLSPQLVALGGKLYLAGGSARFDGGKLRPDRSIEVYDPASKKWSVLVDELPILTKHMRMLAFHGKLLIYTAHTESDEIHLLLVDPE